MAEILRKVSVTKAGLSNSDRRYQVEGLVGEYVHAGDNTSEAQSFYIKPSSGDGEPLTVRYGVIEDGVLCHLCNEVECGSKPSNCRHLQEGTVCRYWKKDGTKRDPSEMPQYYTVG